MNLIIEPLTDTLSAVGSSFALFAVGIAIALLIINWASATLD